MISDDYLIKPQEIHMGIHKQGEPIGQEPAFMERGDHHSGGGDENRRRRASRKSPSDLVGKSRTTSEAAYDQLIGGMADGIGNRSASS